MGFLKQLSDNMRVLTGRTLAPGAALPSNQEVSLTQINYTGSPDPEFKEAIYPQWFFSSRLGQPRQVDTIKIRNFAQSAWVQMVLNTFKKQIYTTDWDIVPIDAEDGIDYTEDIKTVKEFFNNINQSKQNINDINSELITDISEIDAGVINYVYTADSYTIGDIPVYDAWGRVMTFDQGLLLKPLGQRELRAVKSVDGSTMLKQVDIAKNLLSYWQYSFKHPRQNPTRFEPDEVSYIMMNDRPYSVYGFSPVQSIQQVLEVLIQGTRYNKDLYKNNAIPDIMVSIPKLPTDELRKLKRRWNNSYKGKPHQVGFINWAIESITKLVESNRDLEWLDGQRWYFKIVFAVFGVSPTEAGFFENSNKSNDDGQERVTVRNALKPYYRKLEMVHTTRTIPEILQKENCGLKFEFQPREHTLEKIEFEQDMIELDHGTMTINEFRKKKGREEVDWGDDPLRKPMDDSLLTGFGGQPGFGNNQNQNQNQNQNSKQNPVNSNKEFKKNFEVFLNDRKSRAYS